TTVRPTPGVTVKPVLLMSKLRYLFWVLSIALATPSEPGLLLEVGTIVSPGWVTSESCAYTDPLKASSRAARQKSRRGCLLRITVAGFNRSFAGVLGDTIAKLKPEDSH